MRCFRNTNKLINANKHTVNIDSHCCKLVKPPAAWEISAGCAAEADDGRGDNLTYLYPRSVYERTQYLHLLAPVSFLRAAPNMSWPNCPVTVGTGCTAVAGHL